MEFAVSNQLLKILVEVAYIQIVATDAILALLDDMIETETAAANWREVFSYSVARTGMLELRQFLQESYARRIHDRTMFVDDHQNII